MVVRRKADRPVARELPPDFVIREVLETAPADVVPFMETWGALVIPGRDAYGLPDDDLPAASLDLAYEPEDGTDVRFPVASAAHRLRVLRALAEHYLAFSVDDNAGISAAWEANGFRPPTSTFDAWWWWSNHVNAALRAFPMFVSVAGNDGLQLSVLQQPSRTTYEVAVLQLAQLATEGRAVLRCANVRCGRPFTRHRTPRRAYAGSEHATGLKYCSRECAKAQSERDRRARRRVESGGV